MSKKIKIIVGVLLVVVVVLLGVLFLFSERILRSGIEVAGTKSLGVETTVKKVNLSLLGGRFAIEELAIGNPAGFKSPHLFSLGVGSVSVKLSSLLGEEVVVHEIELASPEITLEQKGLQTNIFVVLKGMDSGKAVEEEKPKETKAEGKGKTFRIERIRISDPKVRVSLAGKIMPAASLPTIEMTNVTNADGTPLMAGDVFRQVLVAVADACLKDGKGILPDELLGQMSQELASLKDLGGKIKEVGDELKEKAEESLKEAAESLEGVGDSAKEAVEGLKGLLPGRK